MGIKYNVFLILKCREFIILMLASIDLIPYVLVGNEIITRPFTYLHLIDSSTNEIHNRIIKPEDVANDFNYENFFYTQITLKDEKISDEITERFEGSKFALHPLKNDCEEFRKALLVAKFPQVICPNCHGINGKWDIKELRDYCINCLDVKENELAVFNVLGMKVYEKKNYMLDDERFNGLCNNQLYSQNKELLPEGTYFYVLKVTGLKDIMGYIHIIYNADR